MKGRTNVGGGGAFAINGETEKFTVADGARVTAGDFVEYRTQQNESMLSNSVVDTYDHVQIAENLAITLSNNALLLLKMINGQLKIINSYNNYVVMDYVLLSSGEIAVCVNTEPYIIKIKVEDEQFQFVCSVENSPTDFKVTSVCKDIIEFEGFLYLIGYNQHSYSSGTTQYQYDLIYYKLDISNENKITYINKYEISGYWGNFNKFSISTIVKVGQHLYAICETKTRANQSSSNEVLYEFEINGDGSEGANPNPVSTNITENQKPISFFDKYIFWTYTGTIYFHNINSKTTVNIYLSNMGFTPGESSTTLPITAFSKIQNNKLALFYWAYTNHGETFETAVLQINENTGEINRISNIFVPELSNPNRSIGVIYLNSVINDIIHYTVTNTYSVLYNAETNILSDEVDTTYAKPYAGGSAMGVSKQSGTSGQKIEVYVPKIVTE